MTDQCVYHPSPTWWTNEFSRGYLKEYGWVVTYQSRNDSQRAASPRPTQHGWQLTELGTWSTLHSLQAAQQVGECPFQVTLCSKPLPGSMASASRQLFWSLSLCSSSVFFAAQLFFFFFPLKGILSFYSLLWGRRNLVNLFSFREFLANFSSLPPCLNSSPAGWNVLIWEEAVNTTIWSWVCFVWTLPK